MHARQMIEGAALVAAEGPALIAASSGCSPSGLEAYWTASKCRLDRWNRALRQVRESLALDPNHDPRPLVPLVEEILAADMLTRVWTAILCAGDRRRGEELATPLARSVFIGQMETVHRALQLLLAFPAPAACGVALNGLRRRLDRWTDLFVGCLLSQEDVSEFAGDPARAREFHADLRQRGPLSGGAVVSNLLRVSLRTAFAGHFAAPSPNPDLNRQVAGAILSSLPWQHFDGLGLPRSALLARMQHAVRDTEQLLDELFSSAGLPPGGLPQARRLPR